MSVLLHALATGDNLVNLLAYDFVRQAHPGVEVGARIYATPDMLRKAERLAASLDAGDARVVPLPPAPPGMASGTPWAWKDWFLDRFHEEGGPWTRHVWAYGGATKPLSIAMWEAHAELAEHEPGRHVDLYPDQRARVWLHGHDEVPIAAAVDLGRIVRMNGGTLREAPVLTPDQRKWSLPIGPDEVEAAKRHLGSADTFFAFVDGLQRHYSLPRGRTGRGAAFEALVVARALAALADDPEAMFVYVNAYPRDATGRDVGQRDLVWTSSLGRVLSLDAKHGYALGKDDRDDYFAQRKRLQDVCGRFGFLAYVVPVPDGAALHPKIFDVIPFDSGTAFEDALHAWTAKVRLET